MSEIPHKDPTGSDAKPTNDSTTSGSASDSGLPGNEAVNSTNDNDDDTNNGSPVHDEQDTGANDHGACSTDTPKTEDLIGQGGCTSANTNATISHPYAPRRNFWIHCYYCDWEAERRPAYTVFGCEHVLKFGGETICFLCLDAAKDPHHKHAKCPASSGVKQRVANLLAGVPLPSSPLPNQVYEHELANGTDGPEDSKQAPSQADDDLPTDESNDSTAVHQNDVSEPPRADQASSSSESTSTSARSFAGSIQGSWADEEDDFWVDQDLYKTIPKGDQQIELVTQAEPRTCEALEREAVEQSQSGDEMPRTNIPATPGLNLHSPGAAAAAATATTGVDMNEDGEGNEGSENEDGSIDSIYGESPKDEQQTGTVSQTPRSGSNAISHWSDSSSDFEEIPSPGDTNEHNMVEDGPRTTGEDNDEDDTPDLVLRRRSFPLSSAEKQAQPCKRKLQLLKDCFEREIAKSINFHRDTTEKLRREQEAARDLARDLRQWQEWASEQFEGAQTVEQANQIYEAEVQEFLEERDRSLERAATANKLAADRDRFFKHLSREVKADPPITDYTGAESLIHHNNLTISRKHLAVELDNKERYRKQRNAAEQKLEAAEEEIRKNQDQFGYWKEQLRLASEQINELHQDVSGSTQEINGLREMMDSYKAKAEALESAELECRKEIEDLKTKEGSKHACKEEKDQIERMQANLNDRDATIQELEEQLGLTRSPTKTSESAESNEAPCKAEKEKIEQLQTTLSKREGRLKEEKETLEEVETVHQNEIDEKDVRIRSKDAELEHAREFQVSINAAHENETKELRELIRDLQAIVDSDKEKQKVHSEMQQLRESKWLLQAVVDNESQTPEEKKEILDRLDELEVNDAKLKAAKDAFKDDGRDQWKELKRLKRANEALEDQGKRLCYEYFTGHATKIKHLEGSVNGLQAQLAKLRSSHIVSTVDQGIQAGFTSLRSAKFAIMADSKTPNSPRTNKAPRRVTVETKGTQTSLLLGRSAATTSALQVDHNSAHYLERLNFWRDCTTTQAQQHTERMAQNFHAIAQIFVTRQRQMASVLRNCQQRNQECKRVIGESRAIQGAYNL